VKRRGWLAPEDDFDDGGTPAYRRRIIESQQTPFQAWLKKTSPVGVLAFSFFGFLLLGCIVFFGGLLIVVVSSYL
jgi:hypothetical protein